jgi:hypothetical protein
MGSSQSAGRCVRRAAACALCWLLVGCGHTTVEPPSSAEPAGGAGPTGVGESPAEAGAGGASQLMLDVGDVDKMPEPEDPCACGPDDYGVVVKLGDDTQRVAYNIAEQAKCASSQPAHARLQTGCGISLELALSQDSSGGGPRLVIGQGKLSYLDAAGRLWSGWLPSLPNLTEQSPVDFSLEVDVESAEGELATLLLELHLCAEWTRLGVPC